MQKMNHDEAVVYDIRSATAYQAGHISGAKSLTEEKNKKRDNRLTQFQKDKRTGV